MLLIKSDWIKNNAFVTLVNIQCSYTTLDRIVHLGGGCVMSFSNRLYLFDHSLTRGRAQASLTPLSTPDVQDSWAVNFTI